VLKDFGFDNSRPSFPPGPCGSQKFRGQRRQWNTATTSLEKVLKELNIEYTASRRSGVLRPKIDIKLVDAIGRPVAALDGAV